MEARLQTPVRNVIGYLISLLIKPKTRLAKIVSYLLAALVVNALVHLAGLPF
jgi:hypothetical protein